MNLFDTLRSALGGKTPAQKVYAVHILPQPLQGLCTYPPKAFLAAQGVYAYRLECMLSIADAANLVACLRAHFPTVAEAVFQEGRHAAASGESLNFALRPGFQGATLELLTNSRSLLLALDALHLQPPAPWHVFPDADPESIGSLQGDMDYWWTVYWQPFWDAASTPERALFLQQNQASKGWADYLQLTSTGVQQV